jgi:transmembrane sensor
MDTKEFQELITKYRHGNCDEAEKLLIERWYWQYNEGETIVQEKDIETARIEVLQKLPQSEIGQTKVAKLNLRLAIVAIFTFLSVLSILYIINYKSDDENYISNIQPGSNKAKLILANGASYDLENIQEKSEVEIAPGVKAIKKDNGILQILPIHSLKLSLLKRDSITGMTNSSISQLKKTIVTISTPTGGEFKFALPDGTVVNLNASSTLKYPIGLNEMPERRVHLTGEAYFDVFSYNNIVEETKRAIPVPFIVHTGNQEVMVLGTEFNINSYDYGESVKTTLIKGSIKISTPTDSATIKPGMAAYTNRSGVHVRDHTNVRLDVAWNKGDFMFERENLGTIMIKISRWYNVEIKYADQSMKSKPFSGTISKYRRITQLLDILKATGEIKYKIEGRKVIISK